jgi:hypothetical protein
LATAAPAKFGRAIKTTRVISEPDAAFPRSGPRLDPVPSWRWHHKLGFSPPRVAGSPAEYREPSFPPPPNAAPPWISSPLLARLQRGSIRNNEQRTLLYKTVEFIGRWSMVDVFVDTFTVALIQLEPLMSVEPGPGLFFFAAVVVLTMLAAESFDPRLIWDATNQARL